MPFVHPYPFDPTYGYDLGHLLAVAPPPEPPGFVSFWQRRYARALTVDPSPSLGPFDPLNPRLGVRELRYGSTEGFPIRGWLLTPRGRAPRCGLILGHGYGGLAAPPLDLPCPDAAYLVPCLRGLGRSAGPPISADPQWHVLHDIHLPDRYNHGGCVDDLWTGVSALLALFPHLAGHLGYLGISGIM